MQKFVKGRTNNHLTWVMVDATDFATPESALSAATKIKIYGKVRGAAGVNFVSSGTGSLANDIQHVGASALGIYTIALTKPDLSDASNAWYDQYVISLSATGAAYQTLVIDGGIDESAISGFQSRLSDLASYLVAMSDMLSNTHSAAILGTSHASDAHSAALIIQSRLSDLDSRLVSDVSDIYSAAVQANSRVLLNQSRISDIQSYLVAMSDALSDAHSDLASKIGAIAVTVSASDISDIASAVRATLVSDLSDIYSAATQTNSRVLLIQSRVSDVQSFLSDMQSDLISHLDTTGVGLNASTMSDLRSAITAGPTATLSDILSVATQTNSRALVNQSRVSDIQSFLVVMSDALSDAHSDLASKIGAVTATVAASDISDIASAVRAIIVSDLSDILSAAQQANSRTLGNQSRLSDIYSSLSDLVSNFDSRVPKEVAARSQLSDIGSDLLSYLVGMSDMLSNTHSAALLGASQASDAHSAVLIVQSRLSDLDSRLVSDLSDVYSAAQQTNSRALVVQSRVSDIYSLLSDVQSDFQSRVPKEVAARSQVSDLTSDLLSYLVGISGAVSDAHSAANVGNSRTLVNQSRISDVASYLVAMSGAISDIESQIDSGVTLGASSLSDLRSAITAAEFDASDVSDIASAVWARAGAEPAGAPGVTAGMAAKLDWIFVMSRNKLTATGSVQSLRNDADSADVSSRAVADDGTTYSQSEWS